MASITEPGLTVDSSLSYVDASCVGGQDSGVVSDFQGLVVESPYSFVGEAAVNLSDMLPMVQLALSTYIPAYDHGIVLDSPSSFIGESFVGVSDSGDITQALLAAPSGKSTTDFVAGRIQDDSNPGYGVNVTDSDYREDEWCVQITSNANLNDVFQFRVVIGNGREFNNYTVIAEVTVQTGTTYNDTVILGITANFTRSNDLVMTALLTLAETCGFTRTATIDMQLALTAAITTALSTVGSGLSIPASLSLATTEGMTEVGGLVFDKLLTLGETNGFIVANALEITGLLTFASTVGFVVSSLVDFLNSMTFAQTDSFNISAGNNMVTSSLSLSETNTFDGQAGFLFNLLLTLTETNSFSGTVQREINPLLSLATTETISFQNTLDNLASLTLNETNSISVQCNLIIQGLLSLSVHPDFAGNSPSTFDLAISLATTEDFTVSVSNTIAKTLALAATLTQSQTVQREIAFLLSLNTNLAQQQSALHSIQSLLNLVATAGITPGTSGSWFNAITLLQNTGFTSQGNLLIQAVLSLGVLLSCLGEGYVGNFFNEAMSLTAHPGMSQQAGFDYLRALIIGSQVDIKLQSNLLLAIEIASKVRLRAEARQKAVKDAPRQFAFKTPERQFLFRSSMGQGNRGAANRTYYEDFVIWPDSTGELCSNSRWTVQQDSITTACMFSRISVFGSAFLVSAISISSEPEGSDRTAFRSVGFATFKNAIDSWPGNAWIKYKVSMKFVFISADFVSLYPGRTLGGPMIQFNGNTGDHSAEGIAAIYEYSPGVGGGIPAVQRLALVHYQGNYVITVLASVNQVLLANQILAVERDLTTGKINLYVNNVLTLQVNDSLVTCAPGKPTIFTYIDGSYPANSSVRWLDVRAEAS